MSKKALCIISAYALFTFLSSSVHALYNGNPSLPQMPENGFFIPDEFFLGIKTGYQGDYVFSRNMTVHNADESASHQISSFNSYMNSGTFTIDFANRVDLYGVLGSYRMKLSQRFGQENRIHISSDHHIAGIIGLRAIGACWGDTVLGFDVKGFMSYPDVSSIELNGVFQPHESAKISDRQWQVGTALSHKVSCFVPYIGLTYTHSRIKVRGLSSLVDFYPKSHMRLRNTYSFGFVFGFGLTREEGLACNLEARVLEETAATLSLDFRF